jgi:type IV pilus assembly protein PilE
MRHSAKYHGKLSGFTMIELMIVITIVGILTGIAYATYTDQVRKARRADATSSLLEGAQVLERCFTRFNAYNAVGCPNPAGASGDGYYTLTVTRTANTYTLSAAPQGDQANDNCGTYTLDHLGNKTPVPSGDKCWGTLSAD